MPANTQTALANAIAAQNSLAASLADETAYQAANGPRPSYRIGDMSYDWPAWRTATLQQIKDLSEVIQILGGPFEVRSIGV
jgi:hypothetical protein